MVLDATSARPNPGRVSISYPPAKPRDGSYRDSSLMNSCHLGATVEVHPPGHDGIDRASHMPHVVAADLARGVSEPFGEFCRLRIEQEPRRLDRIASNADDARLLLVQGSGLVGVDDARDLAAVIVVNLNHHAVRPDLEMAGTLRLRDFGVERRPFGANSAAGHAETNLMTGRPIVPRPGVDCHVASVHLGVSHALGAGRHHLEIIVAGKTRDVVRASDAHFVLGARVEG